MTVEQLKLAYSALKAEATKTVGGLNDLSLRASVCQHVYLQSNGNHVFPLIAAHVSLWSKGYLAFGLNLSRALSIQFALNQPVRQEKLEALETFANAIREINRQVCIDTLTNFQFTVRFGTVPDAAQIVSPDLLDALNQLHHANRAHKTLADKDRRMIFEKHFLHEQENVVGPRLEEATKKLDWPIVKYLALKPRVRFAYFESRDSIWFRDFSKKSERIENGLKAFDIGSRVGWSRVEAKLSDYNLPTETFFTDPFASFRELRESLSHALWITSRS